MSKIGRNEICPCGSNKKYKKCCVTKEPIVRAAPVIKIKPGSFEYNDNDRYDDHYDDLDDDSNRVVDLINDGKFIEAEEAAKKLLIDYPKVNDGFDRLGMLYEKTGDHVQAILMYQKALNFTLDKEGFDEEGREYYRKRITILSATAFNQV